MIWFYPNNLRIVSNLVFISLRNVTVGLDENAIPLRYDSYIAINWFCLGVGVWVLNHLLSCALHSVTVLIRFGVGTVVLLRRLAGGVGATVLFLKLPAIISPLHWFSGATLPAILLNCTLTPTVLCTFTGTLSCLFSAGVFSVCWICLLCYSHCVTFLWYFKICGAGGSRTRVQRKFQLKDYMLSSILYNLNPALEPNKNRRICIKFLYSRNLQTASHHPHHLTFVVVRNIVRTPHLDLPNQAVTSSHPTIAIASSNVKSEIASAFMFCPLFTRYDFRGMPFSLNFLCRDQFCPK